MRRRCLNGERALLAFHTIGSRYGVDRVRWRASRRARSFHLGHGSSNRGQRTLRLPTVGRATHAIGMFVVTEADAAAIRAVFTQEGELSAAIELRRRFPGITDNAKARACARSIAGWTPLPVQPPPGDAAASSQGPLARLLFVGAVLCRRPASPQIRCGNEPPPAALS